MSDQQLTWKETHKFEAVIVRDDPLDNLHISWDDEEGFVFLFTPDMKDTGKHYHIELSKVAATRLYSFLSNKLDEIGQGSETSEKARANGKLGGRAK